MILCSIQLCHSLDLIHNNDIHIYYIYIYLMIVYSSPFMGESFIRALLREKEI